MTLEYKAVTYAHYADPLKLTTLKLDLPEKNGTYVVKPNEILIKISYAGLNPVDLTVKRTTFKFLSWLKERLGVGINYSGTIASIGSEVSKEKQWQIGDKVCGHYMHVFGKGTVSEYLLIDYSKASDKEVAKVSPKMTMPQASAFPTVYGTARILYKTAAKSLGKDAKLLVLGAGTNVGKIVVSLAKTEYGIKELVTTNSPASDSFVRAKGADTTIDYTSHKSVLNPVLESVGQTGKFDAIFDCCGSSDLFPEIHNIIKKDGHYLTIVGDSKQDYSEVTFFTGAYKFVPRLILFKLGLLGYHYEFVSPDSGWIDRGVELFDQGKFEIHVEDTFELKDFQKAFDKVQSNTAKGKIVIHVS